MKPEEKEKLLSKLTEKQRQRVSKNNPDRGARDNAIRGLYKKGFSRPMLEKLTGLAGSRIHAILWDEHERRKFLLPLEKQKLIARLSKKQRQQVAKNNPDRKNRDVAIQKLYKKGFTMSMLAELTGISESQIQKICTKGYKTRQKKEAAFILDKLNSHQRLMLSKETWNVTERDAILQKLYMKGIKICVLSAITGLQPSYLSNIIKKRPRPSRREGLSHIISELRTIIRGIQRCQELLCSRKNSLK